MFIGSKDPKSSLSGKIKFENHPEYSGPNLRIADVSGSLFFRWSVHSKALLPHYQRSWSL